MIEFAVSPLLGKENGQGENGPNAPAGVEGEADTQTSPPSHNAQSGGKSEKNGHISPICSRPCDRRKLVPCPLPLAITPPALSSGNFPISFPFLKGAVRLQRFLGENMGADDAVSLVEKVCPVTWQEVLAGTGLPIFPIPPSPKGLACRSVVRLSNMCEHIVRSSGV